MNDKLELLSYSEKFKITKKDDGYEIYHMKEDLGAFITNKNQITYYRTDCYDSGSDWLDININALQELKAFCELMVK